MKTIGYDLLEADRTFAFQTVVDPRGSIDR